MSATSEYDSGMIMPWRIHIKMASRPIRSQTLKEQLLKTNWWWRKVDAAIKQHATKDWARASENNCNPPVPAIISSVTQLWRAFELSAFLYELGQRITGEYEFSQDGQGLPWFKLSKAQLRQLVARWPTPKWDAHPMAKFALAFGEPFTWRLDDDKWTEPIAVSFDIRDFDNNRILADVAEFLQQQRKARRMQRNPNAATRGKHEHWDWIEALDLKIATKAKFGTHHRFGTASDRKKRLRAGYMWQATSLCEAVVGLAPRGQTIERERFWYLAGRDIRDAGFIKDPDILAAVGASANSTPATFWKSAEQFCERHALEHQPVK